MLCLVALPAVILKGILWYWRLWLQSSSPLCHQEFLESTDESIQYHSRKSISNPIRSVSRERKCQKWGSTRHYI